MRTAAALLLAGLALAGCTTAGLRPAGPMADGDAAPVEVHILAFNDFHGNLAKPELSMPVTGPDGRTVQAPAGGAAWLAATIAALRAQAPHSVTVAAGDMTGASPLVSSIFLDEPTIAVMNRIGVDLNAAGNHEFDRGTAELLRLQRGGCDRVAVSTRTAEPCRLEPFGGAGFTYLSANTVGPDGRTLLPATAMRTVEDHGRTIRIGFIGLTTHSTQTLVSPAGIRGVRFGDEAEAANEEVGRLKAAGADAIVVLIHEGGRQEGGPNDCRALSGAIRPILDRLDTRVDLVVSGHTHRSYICDYAQYAPDRPFLLTSAEKFGTLVTDAVLTIDPATHRVVAKRARNVVVQNDGYAGPDGPVAPTDRAPRPAPDPGVAAIVARYTAAAAPLANAPAGRLSAPLAKATDQMTESPLGNLIADAQLAATRPAGAVAALMNPGGIRTGLIPGPGGQLSYGDIYATQPFGNMLTVRDYSGAELRAALEQQFERKILLAVAGIRYAYDANRPAGARVSDIRIGGRPLAEAAHYRVAVSNFLSLGGDGFSTLTAGHDVAEGPVDVDALRAYLSAGATVVPPALGRVTDRTVRAR
ncbi:multifunctional 2',3'-cyclic-nucleotide 2'-phosphodiesterase/5'-nucleotidase/3'-nucleotidase [Sphingomonas metalli]|uniref:Multifunctional 2',3'-cyclic-nucleotide 2'-phosphodiesterase/5'-nucleotidase/3'-nucleotidase n=1 Tax=Sphingomonas metalli TaxID=1779358 RepID=A0A916TC85_9SPHN|nr:bifunctional metallophosphatase/5'-nucleotidase [Sphingomonas metalli]GGB38937.1 multifunctional 2',3'-cyclic-nucleotide 2'-phosphodiesterase/5'-nucleotidase/3'-nucleotidase [Sphingomonas metalli]